MTDQPPEVMRFFQTLLVCILLTILAQSIGIAAGAAFNTDVIFYKCFDYLTETIFFKYNIFPIKKSCMIPKFFDSGNSI